jgi:hypothetical protein
MQVHTTANERNTGASFGILDNGDILIISDQGGDLSVEQDASRVVAYLDRLIGLTNKRVVVQDGRGDFAILRHDNGQFVAIVPIPTCEQAHYARLAVTG